MTVFLVSLYVGLGGLLLMALPGLRRHGRSGHARAGHGRGGAHGGRAGAMRGARAGLTHAARTGAGHAVHAAHAARAGAAHAARTAAAGSTPPAGAAAGILQYFPEPRLVFTLLALFGAFGNLLLRAAGAPLWLAVAGAAAIAIALEVLVVGRLWRLVLGFGGEPCSPLEALVTGPAEAVTPFRNGKGIVRVVLDGRSLQLAAELAPAARQLPVKVGDHLVVEEVDGERERVVVAAG